MYIYKITNTINNKVYIGKTTKTLQERFDKHKDNASKKINRRLYDSMNHHGYDNFIIEKLDESNDPQELNEREKYWIQEYDSFYLNNKGYNMTLGGDGGDTSSGRKQSKEWIKNRVKSFRKTGIAKGKWPRSGAVLSEETKKKMSDVQKGRKMTAEQKKKYTAARVNWPDDATRKKMSLAKLGKESHKKIKLDETKLQEMLDNNWTVRKMAEYFNVDGQIVRKRVKELKNKKNI